MSIDLIVPVIAVFLSVALGAGSLASLALARTSPGRRRLQPAADAARPTGLMAQVVGLVRRRRNATKQLAKSGSNKQARLQRRMESAGWTDPEAANYYALAELAVPAILALIPIALVGTSGWLAALVAGGIGYLIPDLALTARLDGIRRRFRTVCPTLST